ncbi:MAG: ferrous iron transport protein A [Clostridia bacterium]|nr:ferrous iron transport protein A [Clostridia bacterium]
MKSLYDVKIGLTAIIKEIACDNNIKQRILDLGIVKGTKIKPKFKSPSGNPIAYEVRGAIIAIRNDDAKKIVIE